MRYILVKEDGQIVYPYTLTDLRLSRKDVSFPLNLSDKSAEGFGVFRVEETPSPVFDKITQNLVEESPVFEEGTWKQQWSVSQATPEQIAERQAAGMEANKTTAKELLTESDWTEIPSVLDPNVIPHLVNKEAWVTYRSALRSIAVNPPVEVVQWPTKPEEQWSL